MKQFLNLGIIYLKVPNIFRFLATFFFISQLSCPTTPHPSCIEGRLK
jgi:hypothetical protein